MSVVIAIKDKKNKKIIMGADSQITIGEGSKTSIVNKTQGKIFEIDPEGKCVIGGVGEIRPVQLIQSHKEIIDLNAINKEGLYNYCVKSLFGEIYRMLCSNGAVDKDDSGALVRDINCTLIVAYEDSACTICGADGAVIEMGDHFAIGSGAPVATGVLEATKKLSPKERIKLAVDIVAKSTLYVDNKIVIKETASKNPKLKKPDVE